ncbi:MAG: glycosyltransferase N-terminal domain-containing protein [Gemmatimonadales bacterium]
MPHTSLLYRIAARSASALVPLAGLGSEKVARSHQGRRGAVGRLVAWGKRSRDPARPLVWLHAPSVGEGLQAESVLHVLRRRHPEWQYVYTWFSPSAEPLGRRLPVDIADYLPYDLAGNVNALLAALRPDVLAFSKLDLWPELATRAASAGTRVVMVAATVSPGSGRLRWPVRQALRPGYASLSLAGAISTDDASRLERLGADPSRIRVTGDPRFGQRGGEGDRIRLDDPLLQFGKGAPTMVAGSTWPADERVVLDAFARLHVHRPDARLILVPHEPTEQHLAPVEQAAARLGLPTPVRLSRAADTPLPFLLVDRVGVLAALYTGASMAFVGGGFGRAGLHSVLEPAACGIPVVFGPNWSNSRDAGLLLSAGGAEALSAFGTEEAGEALHGLWHGWMENETRRLSQGQKARAVVEAGRGAAEASAALIEEAVARPT